MVRTQVSLEAEFGAQLDELAALGRRRALRPAAGVDFSSNDYLGLAAGPELRDAATGFLAEGVPIGSGGSRLLRGNHPEHEALEQLACDVFGAESALLLPTGFAANSLLLATLPQRGDLVVHDALVHASAHEGMRLCRAEVRGCRHNDPQDLDDTLHAWRAAGGRGRPWVAVESLYSMDGDVAPLDDYLQVTRRHGGMLLVDEAHAAGVWGPGGAGLAHTMRFAPDVIRLVTLGKAYGCEGALVLGPTVVREMLVNRGRALIFSTAPSPLMAAVARASIGMVAADLSRAERLLALAAHAATVLEPHGAQRTGSQIKPIILGADGRAVAVADRLAEAGFDVRAIRPPTVPDGTARLRVSVTLNVTARDIDGLSDALQEALR